jgi:hypothetical protein
MRTRRQIGRRASAVVAAAVVLVLLASFLLFSTGGDDLSSSAGENAVALGTYRSLEVGASRDAIESQLGRGQDALEFRETGAALEPMDAECIYYPQAGTGNFRDIVQLCFRDDKLVRKRAVAATPGAPLVGVTG